MAVALGVVRRCDEMNMNWCSVGLVGWVRAFSGRFGGFGGVFDGGRDGLGRRVNEARGMRGRLCSCAGVKRACGCGRRGRWVLVRFLCASERSAPQGRPVDWHPVTVNMERRKMLRAVECA